MIVERGLAGRVAAAFIHSKLTPLFIAGRCCSASLPCWRCRARKSRRSSCRWLTCSSTMPGASPAEVEQRRHAADGEAAVGDPRRRVSLLDVEPGPVDGHRPLPGRRGRGERALVRLNQKLAAQLRTRMPPGALGAVVKPRSIDDVPVLAAHALGRALRRLPAAADRGAAARGDQGSAGRLGGHASSAGARAQMTVELDPAGSRPTAVDPLMVRQALTRRRTPGCRRRHRRPAIAARCSRPAAGSRAPARSRDVVVGDARRRGRFCVRDVASVTRWRRRTATATSRSPARDGRVVSGGHHRHRQAPGHQRDRRRHAHRGKDSRRFAGYARAVRRRGDGHAQLRRDRRGEIERAAAAHAARGALGRGPDLARARPARGGWWCSPPFRSRSR